MTGPSEAPDEGWRDYLPKVREYLAYCADAGAWMATQGSSLDPRYHPTADGAAKMIFHLVPADADKIRRAFREAGDQR